MSSPTKSEPRGGTEAFPQIRVEPTDDSRPNTSDPPAYTDDLKRPDQSTEDASAFGEKLGQISNNEGTEASIADDGRVNIRIDQRSRGLSSLLVPALQSRLDLSQLPQQASSPVPPSLGTQPDGRPPPPLNLVVQVVGSRGDVQPFIALGKVLKEQYGHRVRLATHPVFKSFVEENGLEFFSIGGDPSELMAFMVKNPGLMPGFDSLRSGDVGRRRSEIGTMIEGCWRSCIEAGDGSSSSNVEDLINLSGDTGPAETAKPFIADAIIANPPSFAHIHCAEKLGVPLHIMFTMPWSPTSSFPHPLANIQASNADFRIANFMSYTLVDMMTWQGLGDIINRFRQRVLRLEPVSMTWAPGMLDRLRINTTYCWSPSLIPKPADWGSHISIAGFYFLPLASRYVPDPELAAFLDSGPPPVYIGFGSIVVDDPDAMTKLIFDAVRKTGRRALVSKGWGGFGADQIGIPDGVFMLGNCPHDWLFKRVACVVHHGGAGTTAAGIAAGRPTVVVPFFGDQPFWGEMVARAGAGPNPIPYKGLTSDALAEAITAALAPSAIDRAERLAARISHERGSETGAQCFHAQLDMETLRCQICPDRVAVWRIKRTNVRLSAFAAAVLVDEKMLDGNDLKLYRATEYETDDGPWDPITGGATAIVGTMTSMTMGFFDLPKTTLKALGVHPDAKRERQGSNTHVENPPSASESDATKLPVESDVSDGKSIDNGEKAASAEHLIDADVSRVSPSMSPNAQSRSRSTTEILNSVLSRARSRSNSQADKDFGTPAGNSVAENSRPSSPQQADSSSATRRRSRASSQSRFDIHDAIGSGRGLYRITTAGVKSPMDFTLGLARGFHNAPKLYGDETVRKQEKITGFKSGLKAAGKSFQYGLYDGITGLITQPIDGAKKEGAAGFFKGVGKGMGGIVLKPSAGFWGLQGYTYKGLYRELYNHFGASIESYLIASRRSEGLDALGASTDGERAAVIANWREMRKYIRKRVTRAEERLNSVQSKLDKAKTRDRASSNHDAEIDRALERQALRRMGTSGTGISSILSDGESEADLYPLSHQSSSKPSFTNTSLTPSTDPAFSLDARSIDTPMSDVGSTPTPPPSTIMPDKMAAQEELDMEEAIARSIRATYNGDADEDAMIERALRASIADVNVARAQGADDASLQAAIDASLAHAKQGVTPADLRTHLDRALTSIHRERASGQGEGSAPPPYAPALPTRDAEARGSPSASSEVIEYELDDAEMRAAIAESEALHEQTETRRKEAARDEEVVMRYMLEQSRVEGEMKAAKETGSRS